MKVHICFKLLITAMALLVFTSIAQSDGVDRTVEVTCTQVWDDTGYVCKAHVDPEVVKVRRNKDRVRWSIHPSCGHDWSEPCTGNCNVTCPRLGINVNGAINGTTPWSGPFNNVIPAGLYPYDVKCSPAEIGYILIVEEDIPTLTQWGLIIFGVVLIGFITWVFLRRRKAIAVRV